MTLTVLEELKVALLQFAENVKWRRKLTPFEERVKLIELKERLDKAEKTYVSAISEILVRSLDRIVKDIEKILKKDDVTELQNIRIGYHDLMVNTVRENLIELYFYGKQAVYEELGKKDALIRKSVQAMRYYRVKAEAIITELEGKLKARAILIVLEGVKKKRSEKEIIAQVRGLSERRLQEFDWEEWEHPRYPKGHPEGGKFRSKGGVKEVVSSLEFFKVVQPELLKNVKAVKFISKKELQKWVHKGDALGNYDPAEDIVYIASDIDIETQVYLIAHEIQHVIDDKDGTQDVLWEETMDVVPENTDWETWFKQLSDEEWDKLPIEKGAVKAGLDAHERYLNWRGKKRLSDNVVPVKSNIPPQESSLEAVLGRNKLNEEGAEALLVESVLSEDYGVLVGVLPSDTIKLQGLFDGRIGNLIDLIKHFLIGSAQVHVMEAVNEGRANAYDELRDDIGAYQWSAILDTRTCPICTDLDGRYFRSREPFLDTMQPPLHMSCRCILVGILKEELKRYPINVQRMRYGDVKKWTRNKFWLNF